MAQGILQPDRPQLGLQGSVARRRKEGFIGRVLFAAGLASVVISTLIVLTLGFEAISFLSRIVAEDRPDLHAVGTAVADRLATAWQPEGSREDSYTPGA